MTLSNLWLFVLRWRWTLIPGLILALGGGTAAFLYTPPTYTLSASYLFLSPVRIGDDAPGNPFLQLGSGVSLAVDVVAVSLTDGDTVKRYTADAPDLTYSAVRDRSGAAPVMIVSVVDTNLAAVRSTLTSLGKDLLRELDSLQQAAGAPQSQWVTATALTQDSEPTVGYGIPVRNGILAFLAVALFVLCTAASIERFRLRSRARAHVAEMAGRMPVNFGENATGEIRG
jgi:hypothetical protein